MKKSLLFATAILVLASCTSETYLGTEEELATVKGEQPISFGFDMPAATRAENTGSVAATALNGRFIVWGEKNESDGTAASAADQVFKNYKVEWTDASAYKTTSNTKNWEYVGLTPYDAAKVSPAIDVTQTIKYWDYNASSYTFTAVSALDTDITDGKVVITKNTSGSTVYDKGYDIALKSGASLDNIYLADRNNPTVGTGTDRNAKNTYGGNVTMTFRNLMSKIRFGIYENIPGYKVSIDNVEYNSTGSSSTSKFGVDGKFLVAGANTVLTVTYLSSTPNKAIAAVKSETTPNSQSYLETAQSDAGSPILSSTPSTPISTSIATPTYDKTGGEYTTILPYTTNDTNIKIKLDFTLTSEDTGETITVVDATAEIPAAYCQWISNYAYTYILKLNDNTNGQIGGVTGLYPITFDAVQVTDENGKAEYITTISESSITTFGVNSTTGKYVTGGNEYAAGSDIYATFTEGSTVKTPILGDSGAQHVNVFKVTTPDATNFPITEASVAEAIANPGSITNNVYTCTVAYTKVTDVSTLDGSTNYYKADSESRVPGATGYVATLAVSETDYHVDADDPANSTMAVDIYTVAVSSVTEVTDATTLAAGTTYYKKDTNTKAPGADGYIPTIAVEGTDYEVAPKIKAVNINSDASTNFTAVPAVVETVPGEDGVNKTIDALKLTGVKAGTYAIEYEASAAWTGSYKKVYKVIVVQ